MNIVYNIISRGGREMILLLNTDLIKYKALSLDKLYLASKNTADVMSDSFYGSSYLASEIFHSLKEDYKVLSFAGGYAAMKYRNYLEKYLSDYYLVNIKDEARSLIDIKEAARTTRIIENAPRITRDDELNFIDKFDEIIYDTRVTLLMEDFDNNISPDFYQGLINVANRYMKKLFVSSSKGTMKLCMDSNVFAMSMDYKDLSDILNLRLTTLDDVVSVVKFMAIDKDRIILLKFNDNLIIFTKDCYYLFDYDKKNNVHIDKNMALLGLAIAFERKYDLETSLKIASSFSIFKKKDTLNFDFSVIKKIMSETDIIRYSYVY